MRALGFQKYGNWIRPEWKDSVNGLINMLKEADKKRLERELQEYNLKKALKKQQEEDNKRRLEFIKLRVNKNLE